MIARHKIVSRLYSASAPLALHELNIAGVSQAAASARLRELKRDGIVQSVPVEGKRYTAWRLTPAIPTLPFPSSSSTAELPATRPLAETGEAGKMAVRLGQGQFCGETHHYALSGGSVGVRDPQTEPGASQPA